MGTTNWGSMLCTTLLAHLARTLFIEVTGQTLSTLLLGMLLLNLVVV